MGKRLTVIPWTCHQTGDCCRSISKVAMTNEEAREIVRRVPDPDKLRWQKVDADGKFVALLANPCPLLDSDGRTCTVYEVRPYNCRRFGCLRPDPAIEPFEPTSDSVFGCANLADRITDRQARRFMERLQRKAQRWAVQHGWRR